MFKSRAQINKELEEKMKNASSPISSKSHYDMIKDQIDSMDFTNTQFSDNPNMKVDEVQKGTEHIWTRIYLREEVEIDPKDIIEVKYLPNNTSMQMSFICFGKPITSKNSAEGIANYNPEDDRKVLCVMVESSVLKANKTPNNFFRANPFTSDVLIRIADMEIYNVTKGVKLDYYDIDF